MIDEDDWPQPDLIFIKPATLALSQPNGRFIGDFREFWENVGIGFYQNIPLMACLR